MIGYADVGDGSSDGRILWLDVRAQGDAVPALLDFVQQRAREKAAPEARMKVWAPEANAEWRALLEARGFHLEHYSFRMWIDLHGRLPAPEWPGGIAVRTFDRNADERRVYETHQEAFSEERDFAPYPFDDWVHWSYREPFDPGVLWLAENDEELVGIALCRTERGGDESVGWISALGVRKPWRGRGLGRALLLHAFREFYTKGKRRVGLGVDGENATAIRLYERAGMKPEETIVWYEQAI